MKRLYMAARADGSWQNLSTAFFVAEFSPSESVSESVKKFRGKFPVDADIVYELVPRELKHTKRAGGQSERSLCNGSPQGK